MKADPSVARLRFDRFELDEAEARLTCAGEPVALAPKPFAVLCALARTPGSLVTKNALLDHRLGSSLRHRLGAQDGHQRSACGARRRPETAALHRDRIAARLSLHRCHGWRVVATRACHRAERRGCARPPRPYGTHGIVPRRRGARRAHPHGRRHAGARAARPQRVLAREPRMKPSEQRLSEACRQQTEAIVARHVHQLFQRLPMLSGFWLRPDLEVAELSVFTWPGYTAGRGSVRGSDAVARRVRRGVARGGAAHARAHLCTRGALMPAMPLA